MSQKLQFDLVSPESLLISKQVEAVYVPASEGDVGIYANHAPVVATLRPGILTMVADGQETRFYVRGGFMDVNQEGVTVLAEHAVPVSDLAPDKREAELSAARALLENASQDNMRLQAQQVIDTIDAL